MGVVERMHSGFPCEPQLKTGEIADHKRDKGFAGDLPVDIIGGKDGFEPLDSGG